MAYHGGPQPGRDFPKTRLDSVPWFTRTHGSQADAVDPTYVGAAAPTPKPQKTPPSVLLS